MIIPQLTLSKNKNGKIQHSTLINSIPEQLTFALWWNLPKNFLGLFRTDIKVAI
jgi:hypothetical protein